MAKKSEETSSTQERYPDEVSGRRNRDREAVKMADRALVNEPAHKIGEVIPRPDGTWASGRLGGVNSNLEPGDHTSAEEKLRATSNDPEAGGEPPKEFMKGFAGDQASAQ